MASKSKGGGGRSGGRAGGGTGTSPQMKAYQSSMAKEGIQAPSTYAGAVQMSNSFYAQARGLSDDARQLRQQASAQNARTTAGRAARDELNRRAARAESQAEVLTRKGFLVSSLYPK